MVDGKWADDRFADSSIWAHELGARGRQIGLLLAAEALTGIFRLAGPAAIVRLRGVKRAAIPLFLAGYLPLCTLPLIGSDGFPAEHRFSFFVLLLIVYRLLEGLALVALWAWLAEIVPPRLRGRYFATRQRWQLIVLMPTLVAAGYFSDWWRTPGFRFDSLEAAIAGYTIPLGLAALLLVASVVPLFWMPAVATKCKIRQSWRLWRESGNLAPLADSRFHRVLLFGCWLAFFDGLMLPTSGLFPKRALGIETWAMLLLPAAMRLGQIALTPWIGRFSDRFGNRPVLMLCQAIAAFGPSFYLLATPKQPWWLAGAFAVWSATVGFSVCLPNLTLKLARDGNYAAYLAAYFGLTGVAYGVANYLGGWLVDLFAWDRFYVGRFRLDNYGYLFYIGWITQLLALVLLFGIDEPGAWTWRRFLLRRFRPPSAPREPVE